MTLDQLSPTAPATAIAADATLDAPAVTIALILTGRRCAHCDMQLSYRPDPDPADPDTSELWLGVDIDGTLTLGCLGATAQTYECPLCEGACVDEDGYACETCYETGSVADHQPLDTQ